MTVSYPQAQQTSRRLPRWLALLAVALLLGLLIALFVLLWRGFDSQTEARLRLSPAVSSVDLATAVAVSGSGWQPGEQVAICLNQPGDESCDDAAALAVEIADQAGAIQAEVAAGQQLAQGQTSFVARGLESGRRASRTFRVLKDPAQPSLAASSSSGGNTSGTSIDLNALGDTRPDDPAQPPASGWAAEYFANASLAEPAVFTREDSEIVFDWGAGSPDPRLPSDGFSVRWVRRISFSGATYRFLAQADGGVRLFIDGQPLIDQWQDDGAVATASAAIDLTPGEHELRAEYFNQQGNAAIALRWEMVDEFPDWRAEYFANPELAGQPALVRNDPDPNLDWGEDSPVPGVIPADAFSVRWTRSLDFAGGPYRFVLTADDGARLLVDGQPIIDAWQAMAGETVTVDRTLPAGPHQVVVLFRDLSGPARITVGWSPLPGAPPTLVAGITPVPSATPDLFPSPSPVLTPNGLPTATPGVETATPDVTESATPASSVTVDPTATAGTPGAATTTPGAATATPTATTSGDATETPTATPSPTTSVTPNAVQRPIDINPIMGYAGTRITITSGNWSPGTQIRIALLEQGAPFSQAQDLSLPAFTTPSDSSQSFSLSFQFPDDSRWLSQIFVRVLIHNADWSEWGEELFDVIPE